MKRATKETLAGRRYLDLQREARRSNRPTEELIQLYALESFLDRLIHSEFAEQFVLKGGVLLAALEVAGISLDDGLEFDSAGASAEVIREDDEYSGVRVTVSGQLSRAVVRLHVDVM